MLTSHDRDIMAQAVREAINEWDLKLTIFKPLPVEQQINWNEQLHEYSGAIEHNKYINVVAERKDQQNMVIYNLNIATQAGDSADGTLIFSVPNIYTFIDEDCRVLYNGEQWRIHTIKERIGENIIIVRKLTGNTDVWSNIPINIFDVGGGYNA